MYLGVGKKKNILKPERDRIIVWSMVKLVARADREARRYIVLLSTHP
jgi:hypothetical protein